MALGRFEHINKLWAVLVWTVLVLGRSGIDLCNVQVKTSGPNADMHAAVRPVAEGRRRRRETRPKIVRPSLHSAL